ncbi:MAG: hypothetical protein ACKOYM_07910, partial [Actinomycetes bacterium]
MSLRPVHRAQRFFGSLLALRPSAADVAWVSERLSDTEFRLFSKMSAVDQQHSIAVARAVLDHVGAASEVPVWVVTAALTHDVGKTVSGLGTYGRVVATLSEAVGGASMATAW